MSKMAHKQAVRSTASPNKRGAPLRPFVVSLLPRLLAPRDRRVVPARGSRVELTRTADALARILDHLLPLRDPTDRTRDREQHREHRGREAHRLQRDARIKVDVRV